MTALSVSLTDCNSPLRSCCCGGAGGGRGGGGGGRGELLTAGQPGHQAVLEALTHHGLQPPGTVELLDFLVELIFSGYQS